jgi:hypothetical protein
VAYGPDTLRIDSASEFACSHCTYYIAVYGNTEATYSISASSSSTLPKLGDGLPSAGSVGLSEWTYYTFHNAYGSGRDLHIDLTSATGRWCCRIT